MDIGYYNLLEAIKNYYGEETYAQVLTQQVTPQEFGSLLKQLPNCDVVLNKNGSVRSYHVKTPVEIESGTTSDIISNIDSNSTTSTTNNITVPLNTTVDGQSGKVAVETGAKIAGAGGAVATATVAKPNNWLVPLVAVGTLITIGKLTMPDLYQEHPEFFGEGSLAQLDPEMWDEVTQEREHSEPAPISNAARFIDGFINVERDPQTNKDNAVAYADAEAMAYIIKYCLEQGVFSTGDNEVHGDVSNVSIIQPLYYVNELHAEYDDGSTHYIERLVPSDPEIRIFLFREGNRYVTCFSSMYSGSVEHFVKAGNNAEYRKNIYSLSATTNMSRNYYYAGSFYIGYSSGTHFTFNVPTSVDQSNFTTISPPNPGARIAFAGLFGTVSTETPIDGINQESGATTPSFNPDDTYAQILEKIATDLPDLWNKRITQNVVQPDGTSKEYIYLPISLPIPNPNPTDGKKPEDQPISGNQGQEDTKIDPETSPEIILQYTYDDTVSPRTPTDETTGTGSTPPVVIPTGSAAALYSIYNPTNSEVNTFGGWLWSSNFVDQLLKMFNDPMQAIISLHKVFCTPSVSGRDDIKVGYLNSGVEANVVDEQYVTVPCGSVNLREDYNNVFDYPPHTDVSLYLPFIGIVRLDTNDVMRSTITVTYHIDVLTGACLAEVNVIRDAFGGVLYQYAGDCSVRYPLSSGSYMGVVSALLGVAGTVASGGALAPMALGVAGAAMGARSSIERSGGFSGNAGAMGSKKPYLIIQRPQVNMAASFETFEGKPANETVKISECTGFISCTEVHALNTICTESEMSELISLLKTGILI